MPTLTKLWAREVLDSRGRPTVEVEATTSTGVSALAIVPSGASTGRHEALELRDGDPHHYGGLGVRRAVEKVRTEIAQLLVGVDVDNQREVDERMIRCDGTPNKSRLGANAILGASLAVAHVAAAARREPLWAHLNRLYNHGNEPNETIAPSVPLPMVNMISGGLHAGRNLDFQDFLVIPVGAKSYSQALAMICECYRSLGRVLAKHGEEATLVGDEGGYGPKLKSNARAVELIIEAIEAAGLRPGSGMAIALDVASTHFYDVDTNTYRLSSDGSLARTADDMVALLSEWTEKYPIVSIEDGLAEDDWNGWEKLTRQLGGRVQLIGDDLFATNTARLTHGIEQSAANAVLIKINQIGTLSETFDALHLARANGYRAIVSARSGETEDTTIADLATATAAGQIKIGSVARSERLAKYNRLLRIEEELGTGATFAGAGALKLKSLHA